MSEKCVNCGHDKNKHIAPKNAPRMGAACYMPDPRSADPWDSCPCEDYAANVREEG